MGTFSVEMEIGNLEVDRYQAVDALVDTGSSDTAIPENILRNSGVVPTGERRFR